MDASTTALLVTLTFTVTGKFEVKLDINRLIDQLSKTKPVVPNDLNINVSDKIKVSDELTVGISKASFRGSLSMVKTTNHPSTRELELIQTARGNRPYNSISDVQISYNDDGSVTSISWKES